MKSIKTENDFISYGSGVYKPSEIEDIIKIPKERVKYWLKLLGEKIDDKPIFFMKSEKSYYTNFLTMIELYIFNQLRERNISIPKILIAYNELKVMLKVDYPFASSDLFVSGKLIALSENLDFITVNGKRQFIFDFAKPYFEKIVFNDNSKLAELYYPLGKERSIVVNPNVLFGQPTIDGTRISASTLYDLYQSGESKEEISEIYSIEVNLVNDVVTFYQGLN